MANYELYICDKYGQRIRPVPFSDLSGNYYKYNKISDLTFTIPKQMVVSGELYPARNEIALYRNDVHIFQGPLISASLSGDSSGLKCVAKDLMYYLSTMTVRQDVRYNTEITKHVYNLIVAYQAVTGANNRGITLGSHTGTAPTTDTQFLVTEGKDLFALQDSMGGSLDKALFAWEITPARKFNTVYPISIATVDFMLEYPSTIASYSIDINVNGMANYYRGQGSEDATENTVVYYNTASMTAHGTYDKVAKYSDAKNKTVLDAQAYQDYMLRVNPIIEADIVVNSSIANPFEVTINPFNKIRVVINDSYLTFDDLLQFYGFKFIFNDDGSEEFEFFLRSRYEV